MPPSRGVFRIGVAGWDYADWNGIVYPQKASSRFDRLAHLARFVDVIEINSTFYRPAEPRVAASWARRTQRLSGFRFTAKAYRECTHEPETDPTEAALLTQSGLLPLRDAGILGAVLLQFPQSFHRTQKSFDRLERLTNLFSGWPLVLEVRHVSWDDDQAAAWARSRNVGWCVVDQPRVGSSTAPLRPRVTSPVGYLRCHGRNARDWFREDADRDARYDYLYGIQEMEGLSRAALEMGRHAEEVFIIQNNHFRGQAVVNALQMKHLLLETRPPAPDGLVAAYPELAPMVTESTRRLI